MVTAFGGLWGLLEGLREALGSVRECAMRLARGSREALKMVFRFFFLGGVGPEIVDFGPLPGPTRPRGGLGTAPLARFAPIFSPADQF